MVEAFGKVQHSFITKILNQLRAEEKFLCFMKNIWKNPSNKVQASKLAAGWNLHSRVGLRTDFQMGREEGEEKREPDPHLTNLLSFLGNKQRQ